MIGSIVLLLMGLPALAFAAIPLGPFELTPVVVLEERYDSNIFLASDRKEGDFISFGSLALTLGLPIRLTRARTITPSLTYFAEAAAFAEHGAENFQNQGIGAGLGLDFPLELASRSQRLTMSLSTNVRAVTEVSSSSEQSDIGPRTRRIEIPLNADIGYFLTQLDEVHVTYNRLSIDQKNVALFLDRSENTIAMTYYRRIFPTLAGLIEYGYKFVDFTDIGPGEQDFSSTGHIFAIGIRGDPTAQLSGSLRVGIELREFERFGDVRRPFASAGLTFGITPRLTAGLDLARQIQESSNQDFSFSDQNLIRLRFTQQFTDRLSGLLNGSFVLDEFKDRVSIGGPSRRFDRLYEFGGGGEYQLTRWLKGGLSYLYRTKNSTIKALEYVDHRVVFRITASF